MANISDVSRGDNYLELLIFLDQGSDVSQHYIYITCLETGEKSSDLGYKDDPNNPHRSRSYTFSGLSPGTTYTFSGEYRPVGGTTSYTSNRSFTTAGTAAVRPLNFSWTTPKTSGSAFNLTAAEWNALTQRINEFRVYKGDSVTGFTTAYTGNPFTAAMFSEATLAILFLGGNPPSNKNAGDTIYASDLNQLVSALNSVA